MVRTGTGLSRGFLLLAVLPLIGCDTLSSVGAGLTSAAVPAPLGAPIATPAPPTDPLAVFALAATPGTESMVTLADGTSVRARVQRQYAAASGRNCREVILGSGLQERTQLVCAGPEGSHLTPPLLRGGGI
ncbi:DVU3141 family protein [Rhodovarius crocodyli]|nr:DVU3141 family protein [Rhodovarius crocodyli]